MRRRKRQQRWSTLRAPVTAASMAVVQPPAWWMRWWRWLTARSGRRGVTLVETLVAMFIFTLVSGIVFQIFIATHQLWRGGNARLDVKFDAQRGLSRVLNDLRVFAGSSGITISQDANGNGVVTGVPLTDLDGDRTFTNATTGVWEFDPNRSTTYRVNAQGQLIRQDDDATTGQMITVLANNMNGLQASLAQNGSATTLALTLNTALLASEPGGTRTFADAAANQLQIRNIDLGPVIMMTGGYQPVNPNNMQQNTSWRFPVDSFPGQ